MGRLVEILSDGGPIIVLLLVLSLLSFGLILYKILDLWQVLGGAENRALALSHWAKGDRKAAMDTVSYGRAPADRILAEAMTGLASGAPRASLQADLAWKGSNEVAAMNRHIRLLELIAMVSPLLGLLGTVLGMIQSFQELALAEGAANASLLAGGIWQALLTTAAGLIVAIPASIAATLLSERAERGTQRIEVSVGQLFSVEDAKT